MSGCPVVKPEVDGCAKVNPSNNMLIEERQRPAPGQTAALSTERMASSIPKGDFNPDHQSSGTT